MHACVTHIRRKHVLVWVQNKFGQLPPSQQRWHCHIVIICPLELSQYYTLADSHNVALKCYKVAKILHSTMWQKTVTTCS